MTGVRPGLCSVTLRAATVEDVVRVAADAGLGAIEWGGDMHVPAGDGEAARRAARACDDAGIACASYGSYWRAGERAGTGADPAAVLDTTEAIGAPNVRVWTDWAEVGATDDRRRAEIAGALAAFAAAADRRGLAVSLEFHAVTLTETAASTRRLLDEAGRPANLFTYWQPVDGVGVPHLLEEVSAIRAHLSHLHVFRWRSPTDRLALAEGGDLWPAVLALARPRVDDRWEGDRVAFLEFVRDDDPAQVRADAVTLRRWIADA